MNASVASPPQSIQASDQRDPVAPARPPIRRRRNWKKPSAVLGVLIISALGIRQCTGSAPLDALPDTATARVTDLTLSSSANGTVEAANIVPLSVRSGGTVTRLSAVVGQQVRTGDVLLEVDAGPARREVELRTAALDEARARLSGTLAGTGGSAVDRAAGEATVQQSQVQLRTSQRAAQQAAAVADESARLNDELMQQAQDQATVDRLQLRVEEQRLDEQLDKRRLAIEKRDAAQGELAAAKDRTKAAQANRDSVKDELTRTRQRIAELQAAADDAQRAYNLAVADDERARQAAQATADPLVPFVWAKSASITRTETALAAAQKAVSAAEASTIGLQAQLDKTADVAARAEVDQSSVSGRLDAATAALEGAQQAVDAANRTREQAAIVAERSARAEQVARKTAQLNGVRDTQTVDVARQATTQADAAVAATRAAQRAKEQGGRPADIAAARASVRSAEIALALAQDRLSDYRIEAPFDGVVTSVAAKQGEQAVASAASVTVMTTSGYRIRVGFSEVDAARIRAGNPARVTFDALPGTETTGQVDSVEPTATSVNGVSTYFVRVLVTSIPETVRVGMSANVRVSTSTRNNVLVVPLGAVGQNDAGESIVRIVRATTERDVSVRSTVAAPSSATPSSIAPSSTADSPSGSTTKRSTSTSATEAVRSRGTDGNGAAQTRSISVVTVELGDTADGLAEITSGLTAGDVVELIAGTSK